MGGIEPSGELVPRGLEILLNGRLRNSDLFCGRVLQSLNLGGGEWEGWRLAAIQLAFVLGEGLLVSGKSLRPSECLGLAVSGGPTHHSSVACPSIRRLREEDVQVSVLEAIREGLWDYEPKDIEADQYSSTKAMPGTRAKLDILAMRAEQGLPLWHNEDRVEYDDGNDLPPDAG